MQVKEVLPLLKMLHDEGINLAIDTSGFVDYEAIQAVLPYVDIFLYDIKLISKTDHMRYCGNVNQRILENLILLNKEGKRLWIRTPIIPGATDSKKNIEDIATFLNENQIDFERWELCAFNNLCKSKYERLGYDWTFKDKMLKTKKEMAELETLAKSRFNEKQKTIVATGSTRLEKTHEQSINS